MRNTLSTIACSPFALLFFLFLFIDKVNAISSYDQLNSYQYNRKNHFKNNGKQDRSPWFEWWYYKIVLPEKNKSFFFVYGVVNPWDIRESRPGSRALVSAGSFGSQIILEQKFPVSQFKASYTSTDINLGPLNRATDKNIIGQITNESTGFANWDISIEKKWSFNAEDWISGKNITNIEWYPAQASAVCSGTITINSEVESFKNAPCYQDRNWGTLFPEWWTWIATNHFENSPDTALAIGGGKPTVLDFYKGYESVAIGLKHKNKVYEWRPHNGDMIKLNVRFGLWEFSAINKKHKILVNAFAPKEKFMDLQFMTPQGTLYHDYEALHGDVNVQLFERSSWSSDWKLIENLVSHHTGIEFGSANLIATKLHTLDLCLIGCTKE